MLGLHVRQSRSAGGVGEIFIFAYADDITICGPPHAALHAVHYLTVEILPSAGFDTKICTLLMGDEAEPSFPRSTRSLNERIAEHFGLEAVPPDLNVLDHTRGMLVVGTPVGSGEFKSKECTDGLQSHRTRLQNLSSLGRLHPQAALLLLNFCAVTRPGYLCRTVAYEHLRDALAENAADIRRAWCDITEIEEAELDVATRARLKLPYRYGGGGLTDYTDVADAAHIGSWAANASWISRTVPALAAIGDVNSPANREGGYIKVAFDRLKARGGAIAKALPDAVARLALSTDRGLQTKLTVAIHDTNAKALKEMLDGTDERRAACLLAGQQRGASGWLLATPWCPEMEIPAPAMRAAVRWRYMLQQPLLVKAMNERKLCTCSRCKKGSGGPDEASGRIRNGPGLPSDDVFGFHALADNEDTCLGGRDASHNAVLRVIESELRTRTFFEVKTSGLHGILREWTERNPGGDGNGVVGAGEKGLVPDILVKGVYPATLGILGDVRVCQVIKGNGQVVPRCRTTVPLHAAAASEKQKRTKYGEACSAQCFTFVPLVVESYGGIGRDFLKFMEDIITAHAQGRGREGNPRAVRDREMRRVAVGVAEYPPNARAADALIDWERRISVALMRSVGCRLLGGGCDFLFAKEGAAEQGVRENDENEGAGEELDGGVVIV